MREGIDPISTLGARLAGGRWNPVGLDVLYASSELRVVRAEIARTTERRGLPEEAAYPLAVAELAVNADVIPLLDDEALVSVGISPPLSALTPLEVTREVGVAAAELGIGALAVPSVAIAGENLVIFPGNLPGGIEQEAVRLVEAPADW